jgi:hypothetical protein
VVVGIAVGVYLYFRTKEHLQHYAEEIGEAPPYPGQDDSEDHTAGDEESAQDMQLTSLRPAEGDPKQDQHTDGREEATSNSLRREDDKEREQGSERSLGNTSHHDSKDG